MTVRLFQQCTHPVTKEEQVTDLGTFEDELAAHAAAREAHGLLRAARDARVIRYRIAPTDR